MLMALSAVIVVRITGIEKQIPFQRSQSVLFLFQYVFNQLHRYFKFEKF